MFPFRQPTKLTMSYKYENMICFEFEWRGEIIQDGFVSHCAPSSVCTCVDVPGSPVLRLLCQGFIWQLYEEHNHTTGEAIWHLQLSDRHHRRELRSRWVSQYLSPLHLAIHGLCILNHSEPNESRLIICPQHVSRFDTTSCMQPPIELWIVTGRITNWLLMSETWFDCVRRLGEEYTMKNRSSYMCAGLLNIYTGFDQNL